MVPPTPLCSVYRWERGAGKFHLHHARTRTSEHDASNHVYASSLSVFHMRGETFLLVGFGGDGHRHDHASLLYKLDTEGSMKLPRTAESIAGSGFQVMKSLPSVGAVDVEHVSIKVSEDESRQLLVIANGENVCLDHFRACASSSEWLNDCRAPQMLWFVMSRCCGRITPEAPGGH